jgi:death-on-curing protein
MNIVFLETADLIEINKKVVKDYGGISGIRDIGLLESAGHNPQNLHFYQNADLFEMATSYAFSIIQNHPFLDGNKRTAYASMIIFLNQNDVEINVSNINESVEIMVKIAIKKISFDDMVKWLKKHKNK